MKDPTDDFNPIEEALVREVRALTDAQHQAADAFFTLGIVMAIAKATRGQGT